MKTTKIMAFAVAAAIAVTSGSAMASGDKPKAFKKCAACHSIEPGKHKIGPSLAGIVGRQAGTAEGFKKYKAFKGASFTWTEDLIAEWITNTKDFIKNNPDKVMGKKSAMNVKIKKEKDRKAILEYLGEED